MVLIDKLYRHMLQYVRSAKEEQDKKPIVFLKINEKMTKKNKREFKKL